MLDDTLADSRVKNQMKIYDFKYKRMTKEAIRFRTLFDKKQVLAKLHDKFSEITIPIIPMLHDLISNIFAPIRRTQETANAFLVIFRVSLNFPLVDQLELLSHEMTRLSSRIVIDYTSPPVHGMLILDLRSSVSTCTALVRDGCGVIVERIPQYICQRSRAYQSRWVVNDNAPAKAEVSSSLFFISILKREKR